MATLILPAWALPFIVGSVIGGFFVCQDWFGSIVHWVLTRLIIPAGILGCIALVLGFVTPPSTAGASVTNDHHEVPVLSFAKDSSHRRTNSLSSTSSTDSTSSKQSKKTKGPRVYTGSTTHKKPLGVSLEYFSGDDLTLRDSTSPMEQSLSPVSPPLKPAQMPTYNSSNSYTYHSTSASPVSSPKRRTFSTIMEKNSSDLAFRLPRRKQTAL